MVPPYGGGFAVIFRGILLPSEPIQEVDIYRYIWDGHATEAGVNPYRFNPAEAWRAQNENVDGELDTLADSSLAVRRKPPGLVSRIARETGGLAPFR